MTILPAGTSVIVYLADHANAKWISFPATTEFSIGIEKERLSRGSTRCVYDLEAFYKLTFERKDLKEIT